MNFKSPIHRQRTQYRLNIIQINESKHLIAMSGTVDTTVPGRQNTVRTVPKL